MKQIRQSRGPDVRRHAVLVREPEQRFDIVRNGMMYGAALLGNFRTLQPVRETLLHVFLKEACLGDTAMISLHSDRPCLYMREHVRFDEIVVVREFAFGDPVIGEHQLVRMCDHGASRTTSRADLSSRKPRK